MQNYMKTIVSAIKTWTIDKISSTKKQLDERIKNSKADWNQNDANADNYVKNRTHYEEISETVLLPKTTVNISDDGGYETLSNNFKMLTVGETYTVYLNGVEYKCVARPYENNAVIGNGTIYGDGNIGNNEPFSCDSYEDGQIYLNVVTAGEYTISIMGEQTVVHKLDKKYLPNNVATTDDVQDAKNGVEVVRNIADTAQSTADNAQSMADNANTLALNAQSTADVARSELLTIQNATASISSKQWNDIVYGDGIFVARGYPDYIAYSYNGYTWYDTDIPSYIGTCSKIVYGNGMFIILGNSSKRLAYSTDGIKWNCTAGMPTDANWFGIAYGDGKFVSILSSGTTAAYSTNGTKWNQTTMPVSANWRNIAYGNGRFVVVAALTNKAAYSEDGINWTETSLSSEQNWNYIMYVKDKFIAVTYDLSVVAYSEDGVAWTEYSTSISIADNISDIAYGDGKFVALTDNTQGRQVFYSTDGIVWNETVLPSTGYWRAVYYGNGLFVALAQSASNGKIAYSADGIHWHTNSDIITQNNICVYSKVKDIVLSGIDYVTKEYVNNLVSTTINEIANNLSEIAANGSITCGEITTSSDGATITIPNIIGKDNVLLMYLDTTEVTSQKACVCSVSIQGASYLHSIAYDGELYSSDDASLLEYNKTIGSIRLTSAYNEAFRTGKYVYVAW